MPGYRRGRAGPCQQRQRRGMRMLLCPSLLLILAEGASHGYELYEQLPAFGFDQDRLDPSIVYRELRDLDQQGLIGSTWNEEDSKGPKRRVYQINSEGYIKLEEWIDHLDAFQGRIGELQERYTRLKKGRTDQ
jgi:PadR family transcriptional regulator PadR